MTKLISQAVEKEITNEKEVTNENESRDIHGFRLGDFFISLTTKRLFIEGPDKQIGNMIGKRFLKLIKTQEFQKILDDFLKGEEPEQINNAENKLIKILGIPPKTLP